jgi:hypothetical protein
LKAGRVGTNRHDKRWRDEHGNVFESKLEALVFERINGDPRISVRRCSEREGDTFSYSTPVRSGSCGACGSGDIVQRRTYTPDLCISPSGTWDGPGERPRRYLEIKGYFPGTKRNLLRAFLKSGPCVDLCLILERDSRATRSLTLLEYSTKYLKIPTHIWDGVLPRSWYEFR